ncbi:MAG: hypothetical protein AB7E75_00890 [Candidatus Methanomethylophilaceae archaeon]
MTINEGAIVYCQEIYTPGALIIDGTVHSQEMVQGGSITVNEGAIVYCQEIYTPGALIIDGTVHSQEMVQGGSITVNEGAIVYCQEIYTSSELIVDGTASSEEMVQGGSITVNGTLQSESIYTGGELTINGNVTVSGPIEGTIIVEGGTVVAGSTWPSPTITGNAVVVIGDEDIVRSGWKYIEIIPSFDTEGMSGISATLQIAVGSEIQNTTLSLPELTDRINLDPGSDLSSYQIEIRYFLDGVEYISVGTAVFISTPDPGHYTVGIGEGIPANLLYTTILCSTIGINISN